MVIIYMGKIDSVQKLLKINHPAAWELVAQITSLTSEKSYLFMICPIHINTR